MKISPELHQEDHFTAGESRSAAAEAFRADIGRADGTVVPLSPIVNGKKVLIAARLVTNPLITKNPAANSYFYGWEPNRSGVGTFTHAMLLDVYAEDDTSTYAVGHMDWWLQDNYANGGGNMHQAVKPQTEREKLAADRWGTSHDTIAFKLEPEYQGSGIGSLMIAASAVALSANGVDKFYTGALLEPAQHAYARFGVSKSDFPRFRTRHKDPNWLQAVSLPIERLSEGLQADQIIEHFVR